MKKNFILIILFFLFPLSLTFPQTVELKVGDKAPKFYLRSLNGDDFFLSDYCGKLRKPWIDSTKYIIVLDFFATWCQPCLKELPQVERAAQKYQDKHVKFFMIDLKEDEATVKKFLRHRKIHLPILMDIYGVVADKYGVNSLPRLFVIAKSGKILLAKKGYSSDIFSQITMIIDQKLNQNY